MLSLNLTCEGLVEMLHTGLIAVEGKCITPIMFTLLPNVEDSFCSSSAIFTNLCGIYRQDVLHDAEFSNVFHFQTT